MGDFPWFMERMAAFNESFRALINAADASEIVGVQSTSLGLNLVAQAIPWQRGQNIVLCDIEFPSNVYPWMSVQQHGVETRLVPSVGGGLRVEVLERYVDSNTRLVCVSAIQFFSGHRTDLQAIGDYCKRRDIWFVVDAIQAAGHMPIDVQAANIAILCAGGQKSLMGPCGQGFLYVRTDVADALHPASISANSVEDYLHWLQYKLTPLPGAARFSTGTPNISGILGLLESVTMLRELGITHIDRYTTGLAAALIARLTGAGYEVVTPTDSHGPIVTFRAAPTEETTQKLVEDLAARQVVVVKHWDKHNVAHVRASLHCYNTMEDIDSLLEALRGLTLR
jgi:selenocysteine lyase/cysteine desulfurase